MRVLQILILILIVIITSSSSFSNDKMIEVSNPWMRAIHGKGGAIYLTIINHGDDDQLIEAKSEAASMTHLHLSSEHNGMASMHRIDKLALPKEQPVILGPRSWHIMVMGFKQPLEAGKSLPLTLIFDKAAPINLDVPVIGATAPEPKPQ